FVSTRYATFGLKRKVADAWNTWRRETRSPWLRRAPSSVSRSRSSRPCGPNRPVPSPTKTCPWTMRPLRSCTTQTRHRGALFFSEDSNSMADPLRPEVEKQPSPHVRVPTSDLHANAAHLLAEDGLAVAGQAKRAVLKKRLGAAVADDLDNAE